ncbi:maleylpyruvate isomerase N-terminal domain-containing protein [Streptomyces calvus]|uniref:maleylpyruvate isomerase N-terminal domain-containing protein n=1 Tax=Streptomyces TaxID=1883 RepID=UPI00160401A7|nr:MULTISPECIES: maleylpyruvate isomerase N-terminal domain-containing protein [Streptomyces]
MLACFIRRCPALATPAPGWSVAHQIAHLAWTDPFGAAGRDRHGRLPRPSSTASAATATGSPNRDTRSAGPHATGGSVAWARSRRTPPASGVRREPLGVLITSVVNAGRA